MSIVGFCWNQCSRIIIEKKKINIYFFSEAATFPSPANLFLELTNQQRRIRYRLGGPRHTRKSHCATVGAVGTCEAFEITSGLLSLGEKTALYPAHCGNQ